MKRSSKAALFIASMLCAFIVTCFIGCETKPDNGFEEVDTSQIHVLTQDALIEDGISLPKGTKWQYSKKDGSSVSFTLPQDYAFLVKDLKLDKYSISASMFDYSCGCSKSGSCRVIYQEQLGYGCLHNTCTGNCTGSNEDGDAGDGGANFRIVGVLSMEDGHLVQLTAGVKRASLSEEGMDAFFALPEVQEEIESNYAFVYNHVEKPNFDAINPNNLPSGYFIGKFALFGQEIGLLLPKDEGLQKLLSINGTTQMMEEAAPTSCSCSGGGSGCKLEKRCLLGNCVYHCAGCSTCTMHDDSDSG